MNGLKVRIIAVALGLAFSVGAMAQGMSRPQFKANKSNIAAEYKKAAVDCSALSGNSKDICLTDASGKARVARAELRSRFNPSDHARYKLRVATADADYALAKQKCDGKAGNDKDVCVRQAQAIEVAANADATARLKTVEANTVANEAMGKAQRTASKL